MALFASGSQGCRLHRAVLCVEDNFVAWVCNATGLIVKSADHPNSVMQGAVNAVGIARSYGVLGAELG